MDMEHAVEVLGLVVNAVGVAVIVVAIGERVPQGQVCETASGPQSATIGEGEVESTTRTRAVSIRRALWVPVRAQPAHLLGSSASRCSELLTGKRSFRAQIGRAASSAG